MDQILIEAGNILHIPITLPVLFAALQIILDLVLILIVLFLLRRISSFDAGKLETLLKTLKESHELCEQLNQTVAKNAQIAGNIQRIMDETGKMEHDKATKSATNTNTLTLNEKVRQMWRNGASVDEISDATGLAKGEIEVMTSLLGQR